MSLFSGPAEHAANPPQTWKVHRAAARVWQVTPADGGAVLATYTSRNLAEQARVRGFLVTLYAKETRWYAGEPVDGWKPYVPPAAEAPEPIENWHGIDGHESVNGRPIPAVHKAAPGARPYHCGTCGQVIKQVPGGQGTTWVHADSGAVAAPSPPTAETAPGTWTFFGHWEADRIVVEYHQAGRVSDPRVDTGYWEQGLWAASGSGATVEDAQAAAVAEYEGDLA